MTYMFKNLNVYIVYRSGIYEAKALGQSRHGRVHKLKEESLARIKCWRKLIKILSKE